MDGMPGKRVLIGAAALWLAAGAAPRPVAVAPTAASVITLDPSLRFQTFDGWEAMAQATQIDGGAYGVHPTWASDSPVLMDLLVNDLGLTRLRVEVRSGSENPIDYYQQFKDHVFDRPGFNQHMYDTVNDNADPLTTDSSKFHWTELDETIQMLVNPFCLNVIVSG